MKRRVPQIVSLILLLSPWLFAADYPLQYYYDKAVAFDKEGNTLMALDMAREALRKNADHVPSLLLLSKLSLASNEVQSAKSLIERALRLEYNNAQAYLLCAQIAYPLRDRVGLNTCLDKAEALSKNNPDIEALRTQLLIDAGRYSLAKRKIDAVLRIHPGHVETHLKLASLYLKLKQFEKAEAEFRKIQTLVPQSTDLAVSIARARLDHWFETSRYSTLSSQDEALTRALDALGHAYANNPENASVNLMLTQLYALTGRCHDAAAYLSKLKEVDRESRNIVTLYAFCDPTQAEALLQGYLRRNEDDELTRHQAERLAMVKYQKRENAAMAKRARYHRRIALREMEKNADPYGLSELRWAEFLFPGYIDAHSDLMRYFRRKKDYERMAAELLFLRDTTQQREFREMYEQFDQESRRLWYKKVGLILPEKEKNPLPIHIYPLRAQNPLTDHILGGVAIADRTRVALQDYGKLRSISREMAVLPEAQNFSPDALRALRQTYSRATQNEENPHAFLRHPLSLVLMGSFAEIPHGVEVWAELIDAETGIRIQTEHFKAQGRNYLNKAAVRLANFVETNAPLLANILRLEGEDTVFINVGRRDGVTKETEWVVTDKLGRSLEFQTVQFDWDISELHSKTANATEHLKSGDALIAKRKTPT